MTRSILFLLMAYSVFFINNHFDYHSEVAEISNLINNGKSITFILGKDDPKLKNSFYRSATEYYSFDKNEKTDEVITKFRTIADLAEYLSNNQFKNVFSTINIVSHGNPWQGMSAKIYQGGPRANYKNLIEAFDNGLIKPICSNAIGQNTNINIISCGIGKDENLIYALQKLFQCRENNDHATVNISKDYVFFDSGNKKRDADFYFVVSKYKYNDRKRIESKIRSKYHDKTIDWKKALNRFEFDNNEPYSHRFRILVDWKYLNQSKNIPNNLKSEKNIKIWIKTQKEAVDQLEQMQLNIDDLQWFAFYDKDELRIKAYANIEGVIVVKS